MEKVNYPLLYFPVADDHVLGFLVGTQLQAVAQHLDALKLKLTSHLKKEYKRYGDVPNIELKNPRLKTLNISYRPAYREATGMYPLTYNISVPVPIVYGQSMYAHYECFLPLFKDYFVYYTARHMEPLARHLANSHLNQYPPERIFRLLNLPAPGLDAIQLKINRQKESAWEQHFFQRSLPTLNRLAEPFPYTKAVKKQMSAGPSAAWEREKEVEEVIEKIIVSRSNVLVVGEPGTGKSAVLEQAMRKAIQRNRNTDLTFWRIIPQRITGGARYLGEWEEAVELMIEELTSCQGILWVVSISRLIEIGGSGPEDSVAAFMRPFIQQGRLRILGEATPKELESIRRLLPGFAEAFQIVDLHPLSTNQVRSIMQQFAEYSQKNLSINITPQALQMSISLLHRYYPYERFPGKAIKFLGHCLSVARLQQRKQIEADAIIDAFVEQTGLPELFLRDQMALNEEELRSFFATRIIGQPAAVERMIRLVKVFKAGLNDPARPIATLLFAGPTGVGKTATAKALANYFFGKGQKKRPLVRIDMSEFQHPTQITRLIGSGREVGHLVKDIRERPFSVLLLDEIEKADPALFDALLTVLDEGVLVDAFGRVTNFKNTIIIMTSNLGASTAPRIGFQQTTSECDTYYSAIRRFFRPEFINRIDGTIIFKPLEEDDIRRITQKELSELRQREGFRKKNIDIAFTPALVEHLVRTGFDPRYGARMLQRTIEQTVVNPVANWLLGHTEVENCRLTVDYRNGLHIEPQ